MPLDDVFICRIECFCDGFNGFARVHALLERKDVDVLVFWNSIFQVDFGNRFFATIKRKYKDGEILRRHFHIDIASTHREKASDPTLATKIHSAIRHDADCVE